MKIVFFSGSLEPGRDGVGDYTRRLSGELIRQGNEVAIIALNDNFIKDQWAGFQQDREEQVSVLRLPSAISWKTRMGMAENFITAFDPEWLSLQYVPFSFHDKGLKFSLAYQLKNISRGKKWHIMFHELWCGMSTHARWKEKLLGEFQKWNIKLLIQTLNPSVIFTNLEFYKKKLLQIGTEARSLPVFGNIGIDEPCDDREWNNRIGSLKDLQPVLNNRGEWLILGFFGTIYSCPGLDKLISFSQQAAAMSGKKLGLLAIGHGRGKTVKDIAAGHDVDCWETGCVSPGLINRLMNYVDIGVITVSAISIDKSGSSLSWIERGIPCIISPDDATYNKNEIHSPLVYQVKNVAEIISIATAAGRRKLTGNLPATAQYYSKHLSMDKLYV